MPSEFEEQQEETLIYAPDVFYVRDRGQAKNIILTPQGGKSPEERWQTETPYLTNLIAREIPNLGRGSKVLDFGCGIGRLSKSLIEHHGCEIVGVDLAWSMRSLAVDYVRSEDFFACPPRWLEHLGIHFDCALAVWCLQHALKPHRDIQLLRDVLSRRGGFLFVVNDLTRCVPVRQRRDGPASWVDDGVDIRGLLEGLSSEVMAEGKLDPRVVSEQVSRRSFWGVYRF